MAQDALRILADIVLFLIVLFTPILWIIYTDRFARSPNPEQYATLFALAALAGILLFIPVISIIAATGLVALGSAWLSARYALSSLSYERAVVPSRFFPGDEGDLILRVNNRKILPLAWLSITDPLRFGSVRATAGLQDRLQVSATVEEVDFKRYALVNHAAVGPFQSLVRTYRVKGLRRGVYRLGPAEIVSGDPFGIFRREMTVLSRTELIVYPQIYAPDEIDLPFRQAVGEFRVRRALFEDPTLMAGAREYRPGDPLRRMHWKATARTGELQVRMFDPSTTAQLMIVVNVNTFQQVWQGLDLERMEATINVAASLAVWALDRGFAVGMRTNGVITTEEAMQEAPRVPPSASPQQTSFLLEHLARLAFSATAPERVLLDESRRLEAGTSILFVTPMITGHLVEVLTSRHLAGRVSTVYCGRHAAPVVPGLPIHLAAPPMDLNSAVS